MPNGSKERFLYRRADKRFVYHTHIEAWGCVYDKDADLSAIVMVNEFGCPGLTRRIANRLNAGTL